MSEEFAVADDLSVGILEPERWQQLHTVIIAIT